MHTPPPAGLQSSPQSLPSPSTHARAHTHTHTYLPQPPSSSSSPPPLPLSSSSPPPPPPPMPDDAALVPDEGGARQQEGADQFFMILARTCEGWQEGRRDVHRQRHASRRSHSCRAHRPPFMLTNVADITTPGRHQQEDDCEHVSAGWRVGDAGKHGGHHT